MKWPSIEEIENIAPLPPGYTWSIPRADELSNIVASLREWFPSVVVGAASVYLREQFFADEVVMKEGDDRDILALCVYYSGKLVALGSWERENEALTLYARLGVISPEHRGSGLALIAMMLGESLGRAMGAGFVYALATTRMPHLGMALEKAGYRVISVIPGYDREEVSPGVIKRVFEAAYVKILASPEEFLFPERKNMTPSTYKMYDFLFPNNQLFP